MIVQWKKSLRPKKDKVEKICNEIKAEIAEEMKPEKHFPGIWLNEYSDPNGFSSNERVEIKDGFKYFINGKYSFDVKDFEFNERERSLKFIKHEIGGVGRRLINELTIVDKNIYVGTENDNIKIKYIRIDL